MKITRTSKTLIFLFIFLYFIYHFFYYEFSIDKCLDIGGKWDYESNICHEDPFFELKKQCFEEKRTWEHSNQKCSNNNFNSEHI